MHWGIACFDLLVDELLATGSVLTGLFRQSLNQLPTGNLKMPTYRCVILLLAALLTTASKARKAAPKAKARKTATKAKASRTATKTRKRTAAKTTARKRTTARKPQARTLRLTGSTTRRASSSRSGASRRRAA